MAQKAKGKAPKGRGGRSAAVLPPVAQPTASEIVVDQDQSFELVRAIITVAISNITFLRSVFPDSCYEVLNYDPADPSSSYDHFMNPTNGFTLSKHSGDMGQWRTLQRGRSAGADKFLNWLEIGVKDALEKKYLASLQLSFYKEKVSSETLLEGYTISINYSNGDASVYFSTMSRAGNNSYGGGMTLLDAKESIRRLINDAAMRAQDMDAEAPDLPGNRVADMRLTYNETCPKDYDAPGFKPSVDSKILKTIPAGLRVACADTGYHSVRINLFNKYVAERQQAAAREDGLILQTTETALQLPRKFRSVRRRNISQSSEIDDTNTQKSGVEAFKLLGVIRELREEPQDTQPAQQCFLEQAAEHGLESAPQLVSNACPYSQSVINRIEQVLKDNRIASLADDLVQNGLQSRGYRNTCECAAPSDENNTIQCSLCFNRQHLQCYGYIDGGPASEFVCYTCLLAPLEAELLSQMKNLCIRRRILHLMSKEESLEDVEHLAHYLDRDETTTIDLLCQLKHQGLIKETKNAKGGRYGNGKASMPQFIFVNNDEKMKQEFFSPRMSIEHHLKIPQDSASISAPSQICSLAAQLAVSTPQQTYPDGSSTQGTPSTKGDAHFGGSGPGPQTPGSSSTVRNSWNRGLRKSSATGTKRTYQGEADHPSMGKCVKTSEVNSPYIHN